MSRIDVRSDELYNVTVGWDPPLQTFFGQVFDRKAEEVDPDGGPCVVLWVGAGERIATVEHLAELMARYVTLDEETKLQLVRDKEGP